MNIFELLSLFLFIVLGGYLAYFTVKFFELPQWLILPTGMLFTVLIIIGYMKLWSANQPRCKLCGEKLDKFKTIKNGSDYILQCSCGEEYMLEKGHLICYQRKNGTKD